MGKGGKASWRKRNLSLTLKNGEVGCANGSGSVRSGKDIGQGDQSWDGGSTGCGSSSEGCMYEARAGRKGAGGNEGGAVCRAHTGDTWQRSSDFIL